MIAGEPPFCSARTTAMTVLPNWTRFGSV